MCFKDFKGIGAVLLKAAALPPQGPAGGPALHFIADERVPSTPAGRGLPFENTDSVFRFVDYINKRRPANMGLFGGQSKTTGQTEFQSAQDGQADALEEIPELPEPRTNTVIAKDLTVTGTLCGEGVVQIEGTVEGEVSLKGYMIITPTGRVRGPVEADVIRIAGSVEGDITAHDHLRLEKTGTIDGDVKTFSFVIEDGGRLNGRTTMMKEQAPAARAVIPPQGESFAGGDGEEFA